MKSLPALKVREGRRSGRMRLLLLLALGQTGFAAEAPVLHGQLKIAVDKSSSPSSAGQESMLEFIVTPDSGHKLSFAGPWALDLSDGKGIELKTPALRKGDFDQKAGSFRAKVKGIAGSFQYKLVAFICTADEKTCFRDVFTGTHEIKP